MMIMKNRLITLMFAFFFLVTAEVYSADTSLKIYNASGEVKAVPGRAAVFFAGIKVPEGCYIYANPKGPGIGRSTEILPSFPFKTDFREVRYDRGEKYTAEGDTEYVYIYKKNAKIGVSFLLSDKVQKGEYRVKVKVRALMCGFGACEPFEKTIVVPVKVALSGAAQGPEQSEAMKEFLSMQEGNPVFETSDAKKIIESGKMLSLIKSLKFSTVCPERGITGLIEAILLGLLAGFILNFMPCVLPVVSLKILSFVENAHKSRKVIFIQGLLFSAGIIASFLVLASLAAFWGYKWGALFQNRVFIVVMTAFVFAMALSMFNVFIINPPAFTGRLVSRRRNIYPDAFVKGAVATLLATPCSGPLLGGTLAWVVQRPPLEIFVVFISIGVGMAFPYVVLTARPALVKYLPKPGEWTEVFEEIMGFLLMLTVLYLVWISNGSFRMNLVLFLFFVAIAFWQYGRFGAMDRSSFSRILSEVMLVAVIAGGYYVSFNLSEEKLNATVEKNAFSMERVLANRDRGVVSVIEFTADWCPNCKLVERTVLNDERIIRLFARNDVDFMIADITVSHPEAEALMHSMGSSSIPFLAMIPPGKGFGNPACLRDIYSVRSVIEGIGYTEKFIKKKDK
ncbi:MAG TPA: cytochrome c biogenesis protein CcdA [Spirochaetota bacterium]|nr:cytochrome c biogenesis protein CcdA [Spirochaetota bacterium]